MIKITTIFLLLFCLSAFARDLFKPELKSVPPNLVIAAIKVNFANINQTAAIINDKKLHILSSRGTTHTDPRNKFLWVYDTPSNIQNVKNIINRVDIKHKQILINARIVSIDYNTVKSLGLMIGTHQKSTTHVVDNFAEGQVTLPIFSLGRESTIDAKLSALEEQGHAHIISKPEIITQDRQTATIESGDEVPYHESTSSGAASIAFKKAVLRLKVTPEILPQQHLLLTLSVNQDKINSAITDGIPSIHTQQISTKVDTLNNKTIVLGGILEQVNTTQHSNIPILSKIPLLGLAFKTTKTSREKKELFIFVTPHIVS